MGKSIVPGKKGSMRAVRFLLSYSYSEHVGARSVPLRLVFTCAKGNYVEERAGYFRKSLNLFLRGHSDPYAPHHQLKGLYGPKCRTRFVGLSTLSLTL
jgi:hypothetical protein